MCVKVSIQLRIIKKAEGGEKRPGAGLGGGGDKEEEGARDADRDFSCID